MKRDIEQFTRELADYINRFIAGREGSHIEKCILDGSVMNRGHAIPIKCIMPDPDDPASIGPCFYAEELLEQFPDSTVAAIAEHIGAQTEDLYPGFLKTMQMQKEMEKKTVRDINPNELFVTATLTENINDGFGKGFILKNFDELGLTAMIKAQFKHPMYDDQIFLLPIKADETHQATDDDWKRAEHNSLLEAKIALKAMSTSETDPPVCGFIKDAVGFYDYFYLLTPSVWKPVADHAHAEKIYIFPYGAYNAKFCVEAAHVRESSQNTRFRDLFMEDSVKSMSGRDVFVLDCSEMKITKLKA